MSKINIDAGAGRFAAPDGLPPNGLPEQRLGEQPTFTASVKAAVPRRENTGASTGQDRCRPFFLRLAASRLGLVGAVECCRNEVQAALPDECDRAFTFWFMEGKGGAGWFVTGRRDGLPEVTVKVPWEKIEGRGPVTTVWRY